MPDATIQLTWRFAGSEFRTGRFPLFQGILNVTPDSFSDGGRFTIEAAAVEQARRLIAEGADILDIGGESSRPGSIPVSLDEELRRVLPVVKAIRRDSNILISIDTTKAAVAAATLDAGANIINDISGLTFDPEMPQVCASRQAGVIVMHMQGTPRTMQENPTYKDVVAEVGQYLSSRLECLSQAGIAPEAIVLDPGIGFGKTAEHNLSLLSHVSELRALGRPVLIGHSRKGFLKRILNHPVDERLFGTVGVSVSVAAQGADIIRVHDVAASRDAVLAWTAVSAARGS